MLTIGDLECKGSLTSSDRLVAVCVRKRFASELRTAKTAKRRGNIRALRRYHHTGTVSLFVLQSIFATGLFLRRVSPSLPACGKD